VPDDWLVAFREWAVSSQAPQFPSRQEEQEAEWAFRAGWETRNAEVERITNMRTNDLDQEIIDRLRAEVERLTQRCETLQQQKEDWIRSLQECSHQGQMLYAALEDALRGGQHDGPCDNEDDRYESCEQHVAAAAIREQHARALLEAYA